MAFAPPPTTTARRLFSLSGVVPLAVFLALHSFVCASMLRGEAAFRSATESMAKLPFAVELVLVVAPLSFHAIYGVVIGLRERRSRSVFPRMWIATAQRVSAAIALVFVLVHIGDTSYQKWARGAAPSAFQSMLEARLSSTSWGAPLVAALYVVGVACTCFHFGAGLFSFAVTWGLSTTERAKRRVALTAGAAGAVLFAMSAAVVVQLATGSRIVEAPEPMPDGPPRPACSSGP